ncbi:MAG TPA: glycosyltransferase 87 family protein, partial [Chloroflexota bacterium]|nr:glycosyltransferase 87 family protein [Chloroflexota bacterium]
MLEQARRGGGSPVASALTAWGAYRRAPAGADTAGGSAAGTAPREPFFSGRFVAGALLVVLAAVVWRATRSYPTGVFDFYPLYYGAKAWLHGGNAYVLDAVVPLADKEKQLFQIGNVYPLPAVFLALPLSFLPPHLAGTVVVGLLTAGLVLALRLHRWPWWPLLYLPVLEGLRIEQYTMVILVLQLVALWALRERRTWLLALCCAVILSKPNQGLMFVLALLLLARDRRQVAKVGAVCALVWGGAFLLDPTWVAEWIPTLHNSHETLHQPFYWQLGLLAIPLLLARDLVGGALVLQFVMLPFPGSYAASALPLAVLPDRRGIWLAPLSFLWPFAAVLLGAAWATGLTLVLPVVALALL